MFTVHILSDLDYGDTEHNEPAEDDIPDVDLIILNGNIASLKRSIHFGMTLARQRPDTQVIYNPGDLELFQYCFPKYERECRDGLLTGMLAAPWWAPNFHYIEDSKIINLRNGDSIDVLATMGWPNIQRCNIDWKNTWFYKNIVTTCIMGTEDDYFAENKPKETSYVNHFLPKWATKEWVNKMHDEENQKVKTWELNKTAYKLLISHFNPYNDSRFTGLDVSPYLIHLDKGLWVTSNSKVESVKFLGARLVSNPGRGTLARSHIVTVYT